MPADCFHLSSSPLEDEKIEDFVEKLSELQKKVAGELNALKVCSLIAVSTEHVSDVLAAEGNKS